MIHVRLFHRQVARSCWGFNEEGACLSENQSFTSTICLTLNSRRLTEVGLGKCIPRAYFNVVELYTAMQKSPLCGRKPLFTKKIRFHRIRRSIHGQFLSKWGELEIWEQALHATSSPDHLIRLIYGSSSGIMKLFLSNRITFKSPLTNIQGL